MVIDILVGILLFVIIASLICSIFIFCWYNSELPYKHKECPKIKFSNFEKWYSIAPNSWCCYCGYVEKNYQLCYFSFFDFLHYRAWLKKRKKRREKRRADSNLKEVLESVQDDIEIFKARIDNEIEDARRDAKEIKRRLNS